MEAIQGPIAILLSIIKEELLAIPLISDLKSSNLHIGASGKGIGRIEAIHIQAMQAIMEGS